jgi:spore maturation protein CgeB
MKLVIFGLTVTSSWGNGHATLWRGLLSALTALGHRAIFYEHDVPYYASHRDLREGADYRVVLYRDWSAIADEAREELESADAGIVTSYCVDALEASELVLMAAVPMRVFYDLDTPVTLDRLQRGENVEYIPPNGLGAFDLVLSYTGGRALDELRTILGARVVAPLYGSVDPAIHKPVATEARFRSDLSYLGTYAADRQPALQQLFLEPARALPQKRFVIGGSQYPADFPWAPNIWYFHHVSPPEHPAFYSSSSLTLNITRAAMAEMGYCPSGRLFEAAACATPTVSDWWEGLDAFFEPESEVLIARTRQEAIDALSRSPSELRAIGEAAKARALKAHTAQHRAQTLVDLLSRPQRSSARTVFPGNLATARRA